MSLPETPIGASDQQGLADVRRALDSLRTMFHLAALCGIVLSAVIYAFLYKEVKALSRQNEDLRAYVQDFDVNMAPKIRMAETDLEVFARTNFSLRADLPKIFFDERSREAPLGPLGPKSWFPELRRKRRAAILVG